MNIIASFTGRGIDVHTLDVKTDQLHLIHNLTDGVRTGRVQWFTVVGAGVDVKSAAIALKQHDEDPQPAIEWDVDEVNALHADGDHEAASEVV